MKPRILFLLSALIVALAGWAAAQEPILELSITPSTVAIPAGGEGRIRLIAKNTSIHEADDLTVSPVSPDSFTFAAEPETLESIPPFSTGSIDITVRTGKDIPAGDYKGNLAVVYTYCIGEFCFQIAETLDFGVVVEPASSPVQTGPIAAPTAGPEIPWPWIGFGGGLALLAGALIGARRSGSRWHIYLIVASLSFVGLGYGAANQQHEQAQGIGAVLCTSCVGIEEASSKEASISPAGLARLSEIEGTRELIVFYAPWCHACPYAEAMVVLAAEQNPGISYRFVNVEQDPKIAAEYGMIRSGRTIVPAVVRTDTGEVIFGIADFEERLIEMLEEGG